MKVSDLKKWDKNPRKITPSKLRILAKTLKEFGDLSGIVLNKANGMLISGHQRSEALGSAEIEIVKKFDPPTEQGTTAVGWAVIDGEAHHYREVWFDEKKHAAAALAANKSAGEWDWSLLKDVAMDLDDGSFDMELTGFELPELENMLTNHWETGTESVDKTEANLDGITAVFKVKCPQEIKDEVLVILKRAFLETSLEGIEIV